ncbi:MAG: cation:proton antiporter [Patescibacteria group bacterium]|nr:cation:proton antiporter [Patescibacteria group bacterium]
MTESIFIDISLVLAIAISISFIVQLLRQPLIIAYIITGLMAGPLFLNLINTNQEFFDIFAKIGVILLLFLVGLSLNIDYLRRIGKAATITGIGQASFTTFFGFLILLGLGFDKAAAFYLAIAITFSSTIIIMKLLSDKREQRTVYGRYTIGLMLVQDMIAIALMILLPSIGSGESIVASFLMLFVKIIVLIALVYFLSRVVLPIILERVVQNSEFLLIFTMAWCFAVAGLTAWAGLTLEVGAIMAGLSLGSSVYRTEISSRIKPIRDFFIAIFFIILGSEMNVADFWISIMPSLVLSVFVLVGNPFILYTLYRRMKFTRKSSFLAGLTAAQVSEFGFVFLFIANELGFVDGQILSIFTLVALITIFVSSYLITYNHQVYKFLAPFLNLFGPDKCKAKKEDNDTYDVLIFGYHRLGWKICDSLKEMGISFAVVDFDPMAIKKLRMRRIPYFFGDATEVDFLCELPIDSAKMVISTLPRADDQMTLIKHIRLNNKETLLIANLSHSKFLENLYGAGADYIMMPHLLSGQWMANLLKTNNWDRKVFRDLTKKQKEELRLRFTLGELVEKKN